MKAAKVTWVFSEEGEVGFQNGREVSVWTAEGHHRPDGKNWVEEESDETKNVSKVRNEAEKKLAEVHKIIGFGPVLLQVPFFPFPSLWKQWV